MNILIAITTYNRPEMFRELIEDIQRYQGDHEIIVMAFNDGSEKEYPDPKDFFIPVQYHNFSWNHGKEKYYQLVNYVFEQAKKQEFDLFYMLPDDIRLKENFFEDGILHWKQTTYLTGAQPMCLSIGHDHGRHLKPNWTGFEPQEFGLKNHIHIVQTQWNDLCFMCDKRFFEVIPEIHIGKDRWRKNKSLGSGVGQFISLYLHNNGYTMFHSYESLVEFSGAIAGKPSMMFRDE